MSAIARVLLGYLAVVALLMVLAVTRQARAAECAGTYTATVERVIDGDTVDLTVSRCLPEFGITVSQVQRYRLAGVDSPELRGRTKAAGIAARNFLVAWLDRCREPLKLTMAGRTEKYGRRLALLECAGQDASAALLAAGHARPYSGGAR